MTAEELRKHIKETKEIIKKQREEYLIRKIVDTALVYSKIDIYENNDFFILELHGGSEYVPKSFLEKLETLGYKVVLPKYLKSNDVINMGHTYLKITPGYISWDEEEV